MQRRFNPILKDFCMSRALRHKITRFNQASPLVEMLFASLESSPTSVAGIKMHSVCHSQLLLLGEAKSPSMLLVCFLGTFISWPVSGIGTEIILCVSFLKSFPLIMPAITSCAGDCSGLSNMGTLIYLDYRKPKI